MSKITLIIAVIINFLVFVYSEEGYCPKVKLIRDFKPDKYTGKWYEIQRYPMFFEDENKCVVAEYTLNPDGTVGVINSAILQSIEEPIGIRGKATPNPDNPANLTVEFDKIPAKGKYWVLDTDYKSYSLVYACLQAEGEPIRVEFAWILSRTPKLNTRVISKLTKKLELLGSSVSNFEKTDQTNCDYSLYDTANN